jgi:hypothetical protein
MYKTVNESGVLYILMLWFGGMIPTDGKKGPTNLFYSYHRRERNITSGGGGGGDINTNTRAGVTNQVSYIRNV